MNTEIETRSSASSVDNPKERFQVDPFGFFEREYPGSDGILPIGEKELFVGDPQAARTVLANHAGLYQEHSDFFHTREGLFGPRAAQVRIRRQSRALLSRYLESQGREGVASFLKANLGSKSEWPDAGNYLAYHFLRPMLLAPDSPQKLASLLDEIVARAVLANARSRQPIWRRMLLQFRTTLRLSNAIEARQALARETPLDLLDVVACNGTEGQSPSALAEVYLSFLFAVAGSVGFALAWSVYLLGGHPDRNVQPKWVVQEALRLWPVAWQLGRRPAAEHDLAGKKITPADEVVVCPYLVHRNAEFWPDPNAFVPQRWADSDTRRNPAYIPFGFGPHRCIAAELSTQLVSDMLGIMMESPSLSIIVHSHNPTIAAALAPPAFSLILGSEKA